MADEKSKKEKKPAIDFKAKKKGKRPIITIDCGKKKQKSKETDFMNPKKLENVFLNMLKKFNVLPKDNIQDEGTSAVKQKKQQYNRKKKENVNNQEKEGGMGTEEETTETIAGEGEEKKENSEEAIENAVGEGEVKKEISKEAIETPVAQEINENSSQPKYAYLPQPKNEQGYIDCLGLRFEHIIEEKEQIQHMFKTASGMYPNSKEIVEWGNKIENLFTKQVEGTDGEITPINRKEEEIDPVTGIPIVKLISLMDNAQNRSLETKPKQKVFNVSSVPSFDLGIDFDTPEDKPLEIKRTQVDPNRELSKMEKDVSTFMHCFVDAPCRIVFRSEIGKFLTRNQVASMLHKTSISPGVIDCWAMLLNKKESMETKGLHERYVFPTTVLNQYMLRVEAYREQTYLIFRSNIVQQMTSEKADFRLCATAMVLFPVVTKEFNYLLSFNLKTTAVEIIDHSKVIMPTHTKYGTGPNCIKHLFSRYLYDVEHQKAALIKSSVPKRLMMKWRTTEHHFGYGIYMMRHMETYKGQQLWDCGLDEEGNKQDNQIELLRRKYASKIILSEVNLVKEEILKDMKLFNDHYSEARKELMREEAARICYKNINNIL